MSWLGKIIRTIEGSDSVRFVSASGLPLSQGVVLQAVAETPLVADQCYVDLFVESMWLPQARHLTGFYHAMAHVYSTLTVLGQSDGEIAFVSTPSELAKLDAGSLAKVITQSKRALGPVPWRGGDLGLEIGLFSVKERDLTTPFLDMVTAVSNAAGVGFLSAAAPFVPLVRQGVEMITGTIGSAELEVGLDTTLRAPVTGYTAIVAADTGALDTKLLSVDVNDHRLLLNGKDLREFPWMVFSIGSTNRKDNFGEIPELKVPWADFIAAVRRRKRADAADALSLFRVVALTSSDLILTDAQRLVDMAAAQMEQAFSGINMNAGANFVLNQTTMTKKMKMLGSAALGTLSVLGQAMDGGQDLPRLSTLPLYAHIDEL